jgi:hypothetical protein
MPDDESPERLQLFTVEPSHPSPFPRGRVLPASGGGEGDQGQGEGERRSVGDKKHTN